MKVWLNGELLDASEASVSVSDKGFLVGDGVFETLRSYSGKAFAIEDHLTRLEHSAQVTGIRLPKRELLAGAVDQVLSAAGPGDARVRITVTSGVGPAGLGRGTGEPTVLVTATELAGWSPTATAIVSPWPRSERSILTGIKTTSNAENIAKLEHARAQGADEAISMNIGGYVCEGTSSNVFVVRAGRVVTPPLSAGCLAGITRDRLLELGEPAGIEVVEEDIWGAELFEADEVFLTSSTRELQPCVAIDGKPVGNGEAGVVTGRLAAAFSQMVAETLGL